MFIIGPLIELIIVVARIYTWVVIASAILSWLVAFQVVNTGNQFINTIGRMLYALTEPALRPIRRFLPSMSGIDLSPIVLILGLWLLQRVLTMLLINMYSAAA